MRPAASSCAGARSPRRASWRRRRGTRESSAPGFSDGPSGNRGQSPAAARPRYPASASSRRAYAGSPGGTRAVRPRVVLPGPDSERRLREFAALCPAQPVVVVEGRDSGSGIPPDNLPKVFDPFFTTKSTKGTGLGLSVSYGIIRQHHGEISVASEEGQGTTFLIKIPAKGKDKGE